MYTAARQSWVGHWNRFQGHQRKQRIMILNYRTQRSRHRWQRLVWWGRREGGRTKQTDKVMSVCPFFSQKANFIWVEAMKKGWIEPGWRSISPSGVIIKRATGIILHDRQVFSFNASIHSLFPFELLFWGGSGRAGHRQYGNHSLARIVSQLGREKAGPEKANSLRWLGSISEKQLKLV